MPPLGRGEQREAVYTIKRHDDVSEEMVDTDRDGYPDCWEIAEGLNPLESDAEKDSDGDGLLDTDEILRDSNPYDGNPLDDMKTPERPPAPARRHGRGPLVRFRRKTERDRSRRC